MAKRRTFGTIRKLPSGNYQASYIGADGQRYLAPETFSTKTDADAWITVQRANMLQGLWNAPVPSEKQPATDFIAFAKRHIDMQTTHNGNLLRESTKSHYRRLLRHNLKRFHLVPVEDITDVMVDEWWAETIRSGRKTSTSKAYKLLRSVLQRAVSEGARSANPCKVKGAHNATTGKPVITPTVDEVRLIASCINKRYSKLVHLAANAGLRFGEITELRRKDIHKSERNGNHVYEIRVERAVTYVPLTPEERESEVSRELFIVDAPKSSYSIRTIEVGADMTALIDELLEHEVGPEAESLLFPSATGGHLRHDVFMNSWRPALKRAGIRKSITPHSLRHFAGSELGRAGANLAEIKKWLGDNSTEVVMRYVHTTGRTGALVDSMRKTI